MLLKSFHKQLLKSTKIKTIQIHLINQLINRMINTDSIQFILDRTQCGFNLFNALFFNRNYQFYLMLEL